MLDDIILMVLYAWSVLHRIAGFFVQLHTQGLGHEAVIEIMIALVGLMVAVLGLLSALFAIFIGILALWGARSIKEAAIEAAEKVASQAAEKKFASDLEKLSVLDWTAALSEQLGPKRSSAQRSTSVPKGRKRKDTELKGDRDDA